MSEVERLRREVERQRKAATNKINRTKKTSGADLTGTEFDPRRSQGIESRYNARQLHSYLGELKDFMRRSNQFVGGNRGVPLRKGEFNAYKKLESQQEQLRQAHEQLLGHLETPSGMSVAGEKQMLHGGAGAAVHGPYKQFDRSASDITSPKALRELMKDMRRRVSSAYLPAKISQGRENLAKALTVIGKSEFITGFDVTDDKGKVTHQPGIMELTEFQFDAFWFGTNIAEAVFMQYGIETERNASEVEGEEPTRKERAQDKVIQDAVDELGSTIQWASRQIPRGEATEKIRGFKR